MEKCIVFEVNGYVATVTVNRPKALNALNRQVLEQLFQVLKELNADRVVQTVILTGVGEKAFVAGADIVSMQGMTSAQAKQFSTFGQMVMNYISEMRSIVIAAVNGYALGGGCELALACDIRVVGNNAKFGIPETSIGVIPGFGGTQRLSRIIGMGRALEMMATGRQISAEEAYRIGLANQVTKPEELMAICHKMAEQIAANSANGIAIGKQCIYAGAEMDMFRGLAYEASMFGIAFSHNDQREGMTAFLEKRKPVFEIKEV